MKTISKIAAIALVAVAVVGVNTASAATVAELQAMIAQLTAQISALSGTPSTPAAVTFTSNLTVGAKGAEVTALQNFLIGKGYNTLATGYFGPMTKAALAAYQTAKGITPAVGYFGPLTRAAVNGEAVVVPPTTPGTPSTPTGLKAGEASLENFDLSSGDDSDVEEGDSAMVAEIEFDVEDGDVEVNRIDLALVADPLNEEVDPWETFESLKLIADGKTIGTVDLSDEDNYLDEDDGTIRVTGLKYVVMEGKTANIVVEVEAQNSVDGADNNDSNWTLNVLDMGIRGTDGDGLTQEIGDDAEEVDFSVDEKGEGEELSVTTSSSDPDTATLKVEDDEKSDMYTIFAFALEGEESDIEVDTITLTLNGSVAVSNLISDLTLVVDGKEFTDWTIASTTATSTTVAFDIDGDYTLKADDEVTVSLKAEFKAANGSNYSSGATISASIADLGVEGEGQDDIDSEGEAAGDTHTLTTEGVTASGISKTFAASLNTADVNTDDEGVFTFEIKLTSFEAASYIPDTVAIASTTAGFSVAVTGDSYTGTTTAYISQVSLKDENKVNGRYKLAKDEVGTFTVVVRLDPATQGAYGVEVDTVHFGATSTAALSIYTFPDTSSYEAAKQTIKN